MSERRSHAWFEIKEALRLDSCGQDEDAFKKYLEGIQNLCSYIKDETSLTDLQNNDSAKVKVLKLIATMRESLTRVENIVSNAASKESNDLKTVHPIILNPEPHTSLQGLLQPKLNRDNNRPSSLETAERKNAQLRKSYQLRSKNIRDASQRVTLCLELHRRIQENISVARAKESQNRAEQAKKESEALHLATRKLALNSVPSEAVDDPHSWSNKVALCACVIHYKSQQHWLQALHQQLQENLSPTLAVAAVQKILSSSEHPLTSWLYGKQQNVKDRISSLLSQQITHDAAIDTFRISQVNNKTTDVLTMFDPIHSLTGGIIEPKAALCTIAQEICTVLETFLQVFSVSLDLSEHEDCLDACYSSLEDVFYKDLWSPILQLYRYVYKEEEASFSSACRQLKSGTEDVVDISGFLSLSSQKLDEIFRDIQHFTAQYSPLAKLNSLVDITHSLCENDSSLKYKKIICADDLIGLVSCLLVQCSLPQLLSELEALEQLIPHRFLLGEEGYSLTTFQTAIKYLSSQGDSWRQNFQTVL